MIPFLKFLEFVKVVKKVTKYAKICILMVSSVLHITSQVEHTKKRNSTDSESKSETKHRSSELFNSVFLHFILVLPYGKKMFLT